MKYIIYRKRSVYQNRILLKIYLAGLTLFFLFCRTYPKCLLSAWYRFFLQCDNPRYGACE